MAELQSVNSARSFDYAAAGIKTHIANRAQDAAARIRRLDEESRASIVEIGKELLWAKEALAHGTFLEWIAAEIGMSWATAGRYMNVARNLDPKFVTVTNLAPSTLYKLAAPATPPEYRKALVEKVEKGASVDEREIKFDLQDQKRARKEAEIEARKSPDARKRHKRERERYEKQRAEDEAAYKLKIDAQQNSARQAIDLARGLGPEYPRFVEFVFGAGHSIMAELLKGDQERERGARQDKAA